MHPTIYNHALNNRQIVALPPADRMSLLDSSLPNRVGAAIAATVESVCWVLAEGRISSAQTGNRGDQTAWLDALNHHHKRKKRKGAGPSNDSTRPTRGGEKAKQGVNNRNPLVLGKT